MEESDESEEDDDTGLPGPLMPAAYAPIVADILAVTEGPGIKLRSLVDKVGMGSDIMGAWSDL